MRDSRVEIRKNSDILLLLLLLLGVGNQRREMLDSYRNGKCWWELERNRDREREEWRKLEGTCKCNQGSKPYGGVYLGVALFRKKR